MRGVFVNSDRIGQGDDGLGARLMGSFLYSLARTPNRPDARWRTRPSLACCPAKG